MPHPNASATLLAEHADLEAELADPARARRPGPRPQARPPLRRARPDRRDRPRAGRGARRPRHRPRARRRGRLLRRRGDRRSRRGSTELADRLRELLLPKDPNDGKDVILEVKAGEGGEESALFAGDLLRMYLRYAERHGWKTEVLDAADSDLGGYKDVARRGQGPRPTRASGRRLKFEGGVHRVQRVPVTESQGRIHTSRRRRAGAARGRGRRRRESTRTTCGSTSSARPAPAARASTPPTPPCASPTCPTGIVVSLPEREEPAAEQGGGAADPARPAARRRPRGGGGRGQRRSGAARCARSTAPSGSAPTTSRRTGSPTTGSATRPTTSTRCSTATSTPCSTPSSTADTAELLAGRQPERPASPRRAAPRAGWPRPGSSRRGSTPSCCWPHVLGVPRAPAAHPRRRARRRRAPGSRRSSTSGADRVPLQHLTGRAPFRHLELAVGPGVFVPAAGDRAARRLGDRARCAARRRRRSSSTCAPAPARSRSRSPTRCPGAPVSRGRARPRRARLGPAQRRGPGRGGRSPVEVAAPAT